MYKKFFIISVPFIMLAGCTMMEFDDAPVEIPTEPLLTLPEIDAGEVAPLAKAEDVEVEVIEDDTVTATEEGSVSENTLYFDYDSAEVNYDPTDIVGTFAKAMLSNPDMSIRLEGHADERGSRAYNLALGERRAQTVKDLMMLRDIEGDRISVISYGEEQPVAGGHDEDSWQQNRRVEFILE